MSAFVTSLRSVQAAHPFELDAPQPNFNPKAPVPQVAQQQRKRKLETTGCIISDVLGLSF